jgi:hypothetical protein
LMLAPIIRTTMGLNKSKKKAKRELPGRMCSSSRSLPSGLQTLLSSLFSGKEIIHITY